jgi:parvulin-like peptidyl-prolyl isomerase
MPAVVAKFDGKDITKEAWFEDMGLPAGQPVPETYGAREAGAVDQWLFAKVAEHMVAAEGVEVPAAEVDQALEGLRAGFPSEEVFQQRLTAAGKTIEDLRGDIRKKIAVDLLVDAKTNDVTVTDEEVKGQYDAIKAQGGMTRATKTADVSHILVKVEGEDEAVWAAAKEKIDAARKRVVDGGEEFNTIAAEITDDPGFKSVGPVYRDTAPGKMVPAFDELMWSTPVGEVTEPFKTQFGYHILTVVARREAGDIPFDDIQEQLTDGVLQTKKKQVFLALVEEKKTELNAENLLHAGLADAAPAGGGSVLDASS